jgi:hypothetical protein
MRLYNLDGIEEDVQDPSFYLDKELLLQVQEAINELLENYVYYLPMAK